MITVQGFLLGCFLVTAVYHLFLFIFYKRNYAALFFALITFSSSFLTIIRETQWSYVGKAVLIIFIIVPLFYVEFTKQMYLETFDNPVSKMLSKVLYMYTGILTVFVFVIPNKIFLIIMPIIEKFHMPITLVMIVYILVQLIRASREKKSDARVLLLGFVLLFATAMVIFMVPGNMMTESNPIGALGILLLYSITLARRYSDAYHKCGQLVSEKTEELLEKNDKLTNLLNRDTLTNAYSRRFIMEELKTSYEAYTLANKELSLISFDMDLFKDINDSWGHAMGDEVLVTTVETIKIMLDDEALLARIGGEEFLVLLRDTSLNEAIILAERIRLKVAEITFENNGQTFHTTCSLGVVSLNDTQKHFDDMLIQVDRWLYEAKNSGRNKVCSPLGP